MKHWTGILLLLNVYFVHAITELPVPMASCLERDKILNDCNWCTCNQFGRYFCKTRECKEVDMFGHFNDAIANIDVGMDGHGAWRSTVLACEPNVMYQRDDLTCICEENGTWPAAECRDAFRVLYQVEVSTQQEIREGQEAHCEPTKLYVVGCDVCLCDSRGLLRSTACTRRTCDKSTASVFEELQQNDARRSTKSVGSIYAKCVPGLKYKMDCRSCVCMRTNRLSCSEESECDNPELPKTLSTAEEGDLEDFYNMTGECDENKYYKKDCNICYCRGNNTVCTFRKCNATLPFDPLSNSQLAKLKNGLQTLSLTSDSEECGTTGHYKKDCNICFCTFDTNFKKVHLCTTRSCQKVKYLETHCVVGTLYEINCTICSCLFMYGEKWEACQTSPECDGDEYNPRTNLTTVRGYCAPGHIYQDGCNTCKCSSNGVHVSCTTYPCSAKRERSSLDGPNWKSAEEPRTDKPQRQCRPGTSVKFDCNACYCSAEGVISGCSHNSCSELDSSPQSDDSRDETVERSDVYPVDPIRVKFQHLSSLGKRNAAVTAGWPSVNVIPVASPLDAKCPPGHSYKISCNYCFCLANGNTLCTLRLCDDYNRARN